MNERGCDRCKVERSTRCQETSARADAARACRTAGAHARKHPACLQGALVFLGFRWLCDGQ
eukprot:1368645-Pyramimonas_sp.AAC.1